MGNLKLSPSGKVSPVMGARTPTVRNGAAYIGASQVSGDWAISLSPTLPLSLTLVRSGDASLDRRTLTRPDIRRNMGNLNVLLPAGHLSFKLKQTSGDIIIQ